MNNTAGIIFSNLNDNTLSRLTADRTVAAIPFACRYRLVDFSLSNMVNANISNISIVTNYNYRSLSNHIGSGKDWDLARRSGGINLVSPYQNANASIAKLYAGHLEALKSMTNFINDLKEENIILADCDTIFNIDLKDVIRQHEESGANLTIITSKCKETWTSKTSRLLVKADESMKVIDLVMGDKYNPGTPDVSLNVYVMKTLYLRKLLTESLARNYNGLTRDIMLREYRSGKYNIYRYNGYNAFVSSFRDYYNYSIELTINEKARNSLFGVRTRPIYTNVHNSNPAMYRDGADVKDSMIADGCIIEGAVENSILFRNVRIAKGAVVKNSIIFNGGIIGENANINCVVTDKNVVIGDNRVLSGHFTMPFFIGKNQRV